MDKPTSFDVNHDKLHSGVYLSRLDHLGAYVSVTIDVRMISRESLLNKGKLQTLPSWYVQEYGQDTESYVSGFHSLEHTLATLIRTSEFPSLPKDTKVLYVGGGLCLTMFYIVLAVPVNELFKIANPFGLPTKDCVNFIGDAFTRSYNYLLNNVVPATSSRACGNPLLHDRDSARFILEHFLNESSTWETTYPLEETC